ncbi:hypothetical protein AB0M20_10780 [Actinoplanes sp. NPDC051633]
MGCESLTFGSAPAANPAQFRRAEIDELASWLELGVGPPAGV